MIMDEKSTILLVNKNKLTITGVNKLHGFNNPSLPVNF